jgi:eukaryotic-like serine/threonine-protein kinase
LTGCDPFELDSLASLIQRVTTSDPPRPSSRTEAAIPAPLDRLIWSCMAREPARRPATVAEVLAVLASDLGLPPWTAEQARVWWARGDPASAGPQDA